MSTDKVVSMVPLLKAAERASLAGSPAAIGAFNVNFYTQATGILAGLKRADAPGIIQASRGACKFQKGPDKIAGMVRDGLAALDDPPIVVLHLDHGDVPAAINCVQSGFGSVMIDASKLDFDDNVCTTRVIAEYAHSKGASVEGEYGKLQGVEEDIVHETTTYADPAMVPQFFDRSGADALAVAYGTSHGPNKGSGIGKLAIHIVEQSYAGLEQAGKNQDHFLVGHGSSTVPKELVDEINSFGGDIRNAQGVPMDKILAAIKAGIRKVNIDTDLRLGITAVFRKYFGDHPGIENEKPVLASIKQGLEANPGVIDPREYLGEVDKALLRSPPTGTDLEEVMGLVHQRIADHVFMLVGKFGSAGLAGTVEL